MAYEAHKWKIGEEITSDKLNHIENGIAAGGDIQTNIQNPTDGQTLKYDAASGKWVNEEGGGSAPLIVNSSYDVERGDVLNKTWQEIYDAFTRGVPVIIQKLSVTANERDYKAYIVNYVTELTDGDGGTYSVGVSNLGTYDASSADDYPSIPN